MFCFAADSWLSLHFPLQEVSSLLPLLYPPLRLLILFDSLYITLAHNIRDRLSPRSDTAIFTYALRFLLWTCQLAAACNSAWSFIGPILTLPHWLPCGDRGISPTVLLDPYYRRLACPFGHSRHRHFIDPRPNAHSHLWLALHLPFFPAERTHSAVFNGLLTPVVSNQRQPYLQGRRFRTLLLHSTCHSISYCFRFASKAPHF